MGNLAMQQIWEIPELLSGRALKGKSSKPWPKISGLPDSIYEWSKACDSEERRCVTKRNARGQTGEQYGICMEYI